MVYKEEHIYLLGLPFSLYERLLNKRGKNKWGKKSAIINLIKLQKCNDDKIHLKILKH